MGIALTSAQVARFARYCELIRKANSRMNLTALREPEQIVRGLFLESLAMASALPAEYLVSDRRVRVVDVGSGAGIPGLPLKICFTAWEVTLVESVRKKARFLEEAVAALQLHDVDVEARRAEELGRDPDFRDGADLCLARAVAPLPTLIEYCGPLVQPGGYLVLPKSAGARGEVAEASAAAQLLGVEFISVQPAAGITGAGPDHVVVLYRKLRPTPAGYPRRTGLARSRPIGAWLRPPDPARARQSPPE
jgi:16S rRNA (guanine527-N7)-methyltransferase